MKLNYITLLLIIFSSIPTVLKSQSPSFDKGRKAFKDDDYGAAMIHLNQAVTNEKFEMKGKDLPYAYAYLAIIRTSHISQLLSNPTVESIEANQGILKQCIDEMLNATKFQSSQTKTLLAETKATLESITVNIGLVLSNEIMLTDADRSSNRTVYLSEIITKELEGLKEITSNNWIIYDILGLANYHLDNKDLSMDEYRKARSIYSKLEAQSKTELHLTNYILSTRYMFRERLNLEETYEICKTASKYTNEMMFELSEDNVGNLKNLSLIENRFYNIKTQLEKSEGYE